MDKLVITKLDPVQLHFFMQEVLAIRKTVITYGLPTQGTMGSGLVWEVSAYGTSFTILVAEDMIIDGRASCMLTIRDDLTNVCQLVHFLLPTANDNYNRVIRWTEDLSLFRMVYEMLPILKSVTYNVLEGYV